jgi:hypothetical protein
MQVNYYAKYLKYKQKYLDLKEEMMSVGGGGYDEILKATQQCFEPLKKGQSLDAHNKACAAAKKGLANKEWLKSYDIMQFGKKTLPGNHSSVAKDAMEAIYAAARKRCKEVITSSKAAPTANAASTAIADACKFGDSDSDSDSDSDYMDVK